MSDGGPAVTTAPSPGSQPAAPEALPKEAPAKEAKAEGPKPIRPIPDKPRGQSLPGVWTQRGDPQDEIIERKRKERAEAAKAKPAEGSDAGADKTVAQTKEETAKASAPPKPAATPVPESEPFTQEHLDALEAEDADPEKVKHALKTLKGMHKAVLKAKEEARQTRTKAIDLANQWKAEAERVTAELEQARRGGAAPGSATPQPTAEGAGKGAAAAPDPAAKLLEAIPLDTFEAIAEKHGQGVALTWALQKAQDLTRAEFQAMLDQRLAPVEQTAQVSAQVKRVVDTFKGVAEIRDPVSQDYFYPELHDPELLDRVMHVWKELRLPDEVAYSPKGVHTAVIIVRDALGRIGVQVAPTKTANPPATPTPNPEVDKVATALAASLNRQNSGQVLDGHSAAISRPNGEVTADMVIRREILAAQPINPKLGFGRR